MSFNNKISSKGDSNTAAYHDQDEEQFEALNQQIKSGRSYSRSGETDTGAETADPKANDHRSTYNESDAALFQAILPKVKSTKRAKKPRIEVPNKNGFESTYKQSDDEQFQALMNFTDSQPTNANSKLALSNINDRSFAYSEQDIKAFNQLTLDDQTSSSSAPAQSTTRADRDVGPIKIMEFDDKKGKARRTPRQSNLNIKVRYFD